MKLKRGRDQFARIEGLATAVESILKFTPSKFGRVLVKWRRSSDAKSARLVRYLGVRRTSQRCGALVDIRSNSYLFQVERMSIGSRVSIHPMCYIDATGGLTIGDDVSIAHSTSILTTNHAWADADVPIRDQPVTHAEVVIGSDVWIGAGVRIMAGVSIGSGAVIAAGSVVTRDVASGTVVAGVPARLLRHR